MARRSRRPSSRPTAHPLRGISISTANHRLQGVSSYNLSPLRLWPVAAKRAQPIRADLRPREDRRTFHPSRFTRPAVTIGPRLGSRLVVSPPTKRQRGGLPTTVSFAAPKKVVICVRRQRRKEVIFAMGKGGSHAPRVNHRNQFSDVRC